MKRGKVDKNSWGKGKGKGKAGSGVSGRGDEWVGEGVEGKEGVSASR